jgi:hypothetical protein
VLVVLRSLRFPTTPGGDKGAPAGEVRRSPSTPPLPGETHIFVVGFGRRR